MIAVTGTGGQLGYDVVKELKKRNIECIGLSRADLDVTDKQQISSFFQEQKPAAFIHCAAYNFVDKAETHITECRLVNTEASKNIALECKKYNSKMMFISTDYVFSGDKEGEYQVDDIKEPLNVYGKSKSDGEDVVRSVLDRYFILRTSWLFGINGGNFVKTMLKLAASANSNKEISVVKDQIGSPTYSKDLAKLICDIAATEKYGIYHTTNQGFCSWSEFAEKIIELSKKKAIIKPVCTSEYKASGQAARRPLNSKLSKQSLDIQGFDRLPRWEDALARYMKELECKI